MPPLDPWQCPRWPDSPLMDKVGSCQMWKAEKWRNVRTDLLQKCLYQKNGRISKTFGFFLLTPFEYLKNIETLSTFSDISDMLTPSGTTPSVGDAKNSQIHKPITLQFLILIQSYIQPDGCFLQWLVRRSCFLIDLSPDDLQDTNISSLVAPWKDRRASCRAYGACPPESGPNRSRSDTWNREANPPLGGKGKIEVKPGRNWNWNIWNQKILWKGFHQKTLGNKTKTQKTHSSLSVVMETITII